MRPHNDIAEPDPIEALHHVRQSAEKWQATAERLAKQRDDAIAQRDKALDALREIVATPGSEHIGKGRDRFTLINGHRKVVAIAQAALDDPNEDESPEVARPGRWHDD